MKKVLCVALFLFCTVATGQVMNRPLTILRTINLIPMGTSVPGSCAVNEVFGETDTAKMWLCTTTNNWTAIGSFDESLNYTPTGDWDFQGAFSYSPGAAAEWSFETETDDGAAKHIYDETMVYGSTAQSTPYNNGWVKLYLREVIDAAAVDAALSDAEAIQMLAGAMTVTGTNAVGQDMQWINIVAQGQPSTGETQQTLRAALMDTQVFGDGASNITENVLVRMLSAAGKTGTYGTARGFRVTNAFSGTKPDSIEAIKIDALTDAYVQNASALVIGDVSGGSGSAWGIDLNDDLMQFGRDVDEDILIHFDTLEGSSKRFGWSEEFDSFFLDHSLQFLADQGIELKSVDAPAGSRDTTLVGWNGTEIVLTAIGPQGTTGQIYLNLPPQNLTGVNCSVGQTGLDTGVNPEFCYCQPANTWNCVTLTAGGPAD